jgi:hypothetical protein
VVLRDTVTVVEGRGGAVVRFTREVAFAARGRGGTTVYPSRDAPLDS